MIKLRPYQLEVARAITDSITANKGLTFSVEIARQGGKNELSAILEVTLLTLFSYRGGNIIKASPTFKPQTIISMQRLKQRLADYGFDGSYHSEMGYIIRLGDARVIFLSAEESSSIVGHTADILLEVDESQDVSKEKYTKEFRPMGSATNVTTVHYGTTWDDSTLLEEVKQTNLELQRKDGIKRHFSYDWQEVAKYNPDYRKYVEAERHRLGEQHPLFLTQYALVPIHGGLGFLGPVQRAQLQGTHARQHYKEHGKIYVAGIDLAGEAEEAQDAALRSLKPRQDSTVVTIAELEFTREGDIIKQTKARIREHYWWTGRSHPSLFQQLVDILHNVWGCKRIVVDATGVGEPVASFLRQALGARVVPFYFTQRSKSQLGFDLLAAINSGSLKMYVPDGSPEYQQLFLEAEKAKAHYRPSQTMDFYVDPSEGHDDFLMSLALVVQAAQDYTPKKAKGGLRDEDN
jgi:hypothetical protein